MAKYFNEGYMILDGDGLLKLTDITISFAGDTDEVTTFDTFPWKDYESTYQGWTASANGVFESGTTELSKWSGETRISGATSGAELLEKAKVRTSKNDFAVKVMPGLFQTGQVIITAYELSGAVGSKMTFSLSLQGCGALAKASS